MKLYGIIESVKRIRINKHECLGVTFAFKNRFRIRVADDTMRDGGLFSEVILHELLHLWFFISCTFAKKTISERRQHKIINKAIPYIARLCLKEFGNG